MRWSNVTDLSPQLEINYFLFARSVPPTIDESFALIASFQWRENEQETAESIR